MWHGPCRLPRRRLESAGSTKETDIDIQRPSVAAKRRKQRIALVAGTVLLLILVTVGLSRLEPAAPSIERATVWVDTVKRGSMLRQVRGTGSLVPEEIRWIPAVTEGRVERIKTLPGTVVKADTVLLELSNPDVGLAERDAASELKAGEAELLNLKAQLQSQLLTQQAAAALVQADYRQAAMQADADERLAADGLVADITKNISKLRAEELEGRSGIEQKRLDVAAQAAEAQLAVQQARVGRLKEAHDLRKSQLAALKVRAGVEGVLQLIPVEVASIDTRNGVIAGRVSRIDPSVQNGTVTVDVALTGELPRGARPDLTVDGTIELERLENVLYVGRPAFGQEKSTVSLFRLAAGGKQANRTQVKLGRSSVNTVEILEGLKEGEQVILSDTSAWDSYDRVRLN
jgi:HlyD family secretion protein